MARARVHRHAGRELQASSSPRPSRATTLTYDFTGSSPQVGLGINCCYWATWGGDVRADLPAARLGRDLERGRHAADPADRPGGHGRQLHPAGADLDRDRRDDPDRQQPLDPRALEDVRRRASATSDRATAVWHGSHAHVETHGVDAEGDFFVAPLTDTFGGAAGARAFRDGVDLGGEIPNVVSRWANAESQELNTPLLYLYRRAVPDSGGPGQVPRRRLPRVRVHAERARRARWG